MYRQVDSKLWTDQKFLSLGNDGRMLWLFLLTTRFAVNIIPGVIIAGDGAIAEDLDWKPARLRAAFADLSDRGMSIRRDGRLIWLPNALKHQKIPGPRSVVGIGKVWGDVPDGELKLEILAALAEKCSTWSVVFGEVFAKHLPAIQGKGIGKGIPNPTPQVEGNGSTQEQYQEQKQDQEQEEYSAKRGVYARERHPDVGRIASKVWNHAGVTGGQLKLSGLTVAPWPLTKQTGLAWDDLCNRIGELLVDSTAAQAESVAINRVNVAVAKARADGDGSYFTPEAMFTERSFATWSRLTPEQVSRKQTRTQTKSAVEAQLDRVRMLEAEEAAQEGKS